MTREIRMMIRAAIVAAAFGSWTASADVPKISEPPGAALESWYQVRIDGAYVGYLRIARDEVKMEGRGVRYTREEWVWKGADGTRHVMESDFWRETDETLIRAAISERTETDLHVAVSDKKTTIEVRDGSVLTSVVQNGQTTRKTVRIPEGVAMATDLNFAAHKVEAGRECEATTFSIRALEFVKQKVHHVARAQFEHRGERVDGLTATTSEITDGNERVLWNMWMTRDFAVLRATWGDGWEMIAATKEEALGRKAAAERNAAPLGR